MACANASAQETVSFIRDDQKVTAALAYAPKLVICSGIAIVSPGAGGSEHGYRYLGEALSALGYMTIVTGHQESGARVFREHLLRDGIQRGLAKLITDPNAYRGRLMDVAAARRWALERCGSSESILIGHSMGAATVMLG